MVWPAGRSKDAPEAGTTGSVTPDSSPSPAPAGPSTTARTYSTKERQAFRRRGISDTPLDQLQKMSHQDLRARARTALNVLRDARDDLKSGGATKSEVKGIRQMVRETLSERARRHVNATSDYQALGRLRGDLRRFQAFAHIHPNSGLQEDIRTHLSRQTNDRIRHHRRNIHNRREGEWSVVTRTGALNKLMVRARKIMAAVKARSKKES